MDDPDRLRARESRTGSRNRRLLLRIRDPHTDIKAVNQDAQLSQLHVARIEPSHVVPPFARLDGNDAATPIIGSHQRIADLRELGDVLLLACGSNESLSPFGLFLDNALRIDGLAAWKVFQAS